MGRSDQQWRSDILSGTSSGNRLAGRVFQDGRFWLAELPALDLMTQGTSRDDAYAMVKDLLETLVDVPEFSVRVEPDEDGGFAVTSHELDRRDPTQQVDERHLGLVVQSAIPT